MKLQGRIDLQNHVFEDVGLKLDIYQTRSIEKYIDNRERKYRKDYQLQKLGMRSIYSVIFTVLVFVSFQFAGWKYIAFISLLALYNLIHLLSDWVFWKNNFSDGSK